MTSIASAPSAAPRSSSRVNNASSDLRLTSYSFSIRVSTGLMKCAVTTGMGFFIRSVLRASLPQEDPSAAFLVDTFKWANKAAPASLL